MTGEGAQNDPAADDAAVEPGTEGIQDNAAPEDPAQDDIPANGQGKAPEGPAAGVHAQAGDASLQRFYDDLAVKDRLVSRLSKVVGAFDHRAMDSAKVAAYGVNKLKLKCAKGQEAVVLDSYLTGVEARKTADASNVARRAADSANATSELTAYLEGK